MEKLSGDLINAYIKKHITELYENVSKAASSNIGKEENFRTEMAIILNKIFLDLDIKEQINSEQEYSVYNGRIDSLYGNVIIEYKAPGRINENIENSSNVDFIEQVKRQINGLSLKNKSSKEKILGVIFDGKNIIYVKYKNNSWEVSNVQKVTQESLSLLLKRILSLSIEKKALIIENLLRDFDSESALTKKFINKLYYYYINNQEYKKVKLLFEQWKQLFREICGYDFETLDIKIRELKNVYEIRDKVKIEYLIFAIQTYFALIIKFLSIDVLKYICSKKEGGLDKFNIEDSEKLKSQLEDMEQGGLYKKLGVSNFLEGDFFGGYLYFWNEDLYELIKQMLEKFEDYDYSSINLEPDLARDLLKNVYHNLFPRELRHNLGEYYTPDWLADFLIDKMNIDFKSKQVILDPTCGSGTFIVLLIKRYITSNINLDKQLLLNGILNSIKGYDLNPLAVISARANYIISLGDLLNERKENIEIPIYLCDSMLTILEEKNEEEDCYALSTKAGKFLIPVNVVKSGNANRLLDILNRCIKLNYSTSEFIEKLLKENIEFTGNEQSVLENLYSTMEELEKKGLDGIWANVIKNSFAPLFQKKVDYIIGNPPWIVWQSLPENYRKSIQKYWHQYKIFEHKGLEARLGSSHDDLSVLMTYVIMDNFLKDKGKLGFIVNQNIFQASGGGKGFRKFLIKDNIPVEIEEVNDFVRVQPFKDLGADNKTAIFTAIKNAETKYPVKYNVWDKNSSGKICADESYESVFGTKIKKQELLAKPIKEYNSSWIIGSKTELEIFEKMIANEKGKYRARKGIDTSANAIYWIKEKERINDKIVFENSPETSKKVIKQVTDVVEEKLVYPLVRGKDIYKWRYETPYKIIVPYTEDGKIIDKKKLKINFENTYNYFYNVNNQFEEILKNRGIVKKHFSNLKGVEIPEYVLYDIGKYTFSKYKVVWKALASGMIATVVSSKNNKIVIPDHNVVMIPIEDENEAYYVAGILNSKIVTKFVNAYISWFFSTHILENMNIPEYNGNNEKHVEVVNLSKDAHLLAEKDCDVSEIENKLNNVVEEILLGITKE